ncbi:MAG TPA: ABC transporter permease [Bryobacteraceae bacterium]|jgi:putative ABC transport system permease protein|nr:ABC transporter permease [Bryobacteraceae bacterium]
MAIPVSYNFRNLIVRKTTTIMTALGITLTVAVLLSVLALVNGLQTAFQSSGNPLQILVMRKGSNAELSSAITREVFQDLKSMAGIARENNEPVASLEMVTVINLPSVDSPDGMNVTLRGILPVGIQMRDGLKILDGRWFHAGQREVVVGKSIARRYPGARLGQKLRFGRGEWEVVGVMDGGTSSINSEIFGDLNQASSDFNRADGLSSALIRATDAATVPALINSLNDDRRLGVVAQTEKDYYASQTSSGTLIQYLGIFISIIMAVGSSFAAMNTMYAAVARRAREIGTLRVLGFSRVSILTSFLFESLLLSILGGLLGCVLVLPLNNITTGIGSFVTFSEISFNFRVGPEVMIVGIAFALLMGTLGGLFPARNAANKEILTALRDV